MNAKTLGLGHDDVGAFFCSLWKLPESIVLGVKYHHQRFQPQDLSKGRGLADIHRFPLKFCLVDAGHWILRYGLSSDSFP